MRFPLKKYFILSIVFINLFFSFHITAWYVDRDYCIIKGYNSQFRNWVIFYTCEPGKESEATKKSPTYQIYLRNSSVRESLIKDPGHYFEYYNNMCIFNETLSNGLESRLYDHKTYPTLYPEDEVALTESYSRQLNHNYQVINLLRTEFRILYSSYCCRNYKNPKTHYDNGFMEFVDGNIEKAMEHTEKYITHCQENNLDLEPAQLVVLGESYMVLAQFSRAVEVLTEAIEKDPNNKEAYFHRSVGNFELGNFDEALEDYLSSDRGSKIKKSVLQASAEFSQSFISSLGAGVFEGAKEFLPNLLNSYFGLQQVFWYAHLNPNETSQHFINASCEMGKCIADYCKNFSQDTVDGYVDEMKTLIRDFYQLGESEKGTLWVI